MPTDSVTELVCSPCFLQQQLCGVFISQTYSSSHYLAHLRRRYPRFHYSCCCCCCCMLRASDPMEVADPYPMASGNRSIKKHFLSRGTRPSIKNINFCLKNTSIVGEKQNLKIIYKNRFRPTSKVLKSSTTACPLMIIWFSLTKRRKFLSKFQLAVPR